MHQSAANDTHNPWWPWSHSAQGIFFKPKVRHTELIHTAPQRKSYSVGIWTGRYFPCTSSGLHGNSSTKRCSHIANYPGTCGPRDNSPFRSMGSIQSYQHPTKCCFTLASTVNHSVTFVDPVTHTYTQNIESYWAQEKIEFKRMKGCHAHQLPSYLDEFMWRERHGHSKMEAFTNIIRDIADFFPV